MATNEHQPGTHAPVTGHYEALNVFGSPTGKVEHVREGERLPRAPRGFSWRRIAEQLRYGLVDHCEPDLEQRQLLTFGVRLPRSGHRGVAAC
jgi:hypothetical protein